MTRQGAHQHSAVVRGTVCEATGARCALHETHSVGDRSPAACCLSARSGYRTRKQRESQSFLHIGYQL